MGAERILVIDDEPNVIRLCQRALAKEGFAVQGALSGKEGLELLKAGQVGKPSAAPSLRSGLRLRTSLPYDLILLDIKLPDRDGLNVLSTIQETDPEMAVIIITGHGTMEIALEVLKSGIQDFLLKPFTPEELVTSVQKVLERKRLIQENLSLKARLPILEISKALMSEMNLERLAKLTLETVRHALGADRVSLMLLDEEQQELSISAALGLSDEVVATTRVKVGQGLAGLTAQMRKPILLSDQVETNPAIQASLTQSYTGSSICVPLMIKDRVLGVLNASRPVGGNPFRQDDVGLLSILCGQIAVAIENARLFEQAQWEIAERKRIEEELRHRNEELMALNAIATTIGQSLDLDHILNATLDKVLEVIEIDAGWIQLLDENADVLSLVAHRGFSQEIAKEAKNIKLGESMASQVIQSGQPIVVAEVPALSTSTRLGVNSVEGPVLSQSPEPAEEGERLRAFAGVPIKSKDKVLGVLGVFSRSTRQPSSQEMPLLTATGHQIGVAIENVRLAEKASEIEILRELNRLRSELIANVSHELRTPLGLIQIFCTTLLREDVDFDRKTQREFLRDIEEETDKLEKIVDNLLDLSQMKDGRLHLEKCPTDLGQLAKEVMETMEVQLTQHRFVHDFPSDPLMATVDPKRIEQVLRNLLSNAIKYSPEGGTITVQGRGDKRQLLVRVSDQGMGIPSEDIERVFERFYRVENEITQGMRGVGLGLAVCRGIVEAHGGRIWVESTLGVGSTFYFTLPVLSKVEGPVLSKARPEPSRRVEGPVPVPDRNPIPTNSNNGSSFEAPEVSTLEV